MGGGSPRLGFCQPSWALSTGCLALPVVVGCVLPEMLAACDMYLILLVGGLTAAEGEAGNSKGGRQRGCESHPSFRALPSCRARIHFPKLHLVHGRSGCLCRPLPGRRFQPIKDCVDIPTWGTGLLACLGCLLYYHDVLV